MSWSRRALLLGATAVAGCGFRPLHGAGTGLRGRVTLDGPQGRNGFAFREQMRRNLGDPAPDAPYRLITTLSYEEEGVAISRRDDITRYDVTATAQYRLVRAADGVEIDAGAVRAVSAYSTTAAPYATRIAERDTETRLAANLADRVHARISVATLPSGG
ncbi:MAG: LPS assembly lipoprotein LptE [Rubrimonas sp.]